jgi:hypothetical protein
MPSTVTLGPVNRLRRSGVALATVTAGLFPLVAIPTTVASALTAWPSFFRAPSWTWDPSIVKPVPYRSTVASNAGHRGCHDSRFATSYLGDVGWALGIIGCAEYPEMSTNHGRTWWVGGDFFTILAGDLSSFVDVIVPLTPTIVVAYSIGTDNFDLTSNAGRDWFRAWMPGNVTSVSGAFVSSPISRTSPQMTIVVRVSASSSPTRHAEYRSRDLGRTWSLVTNAVN